MNVKSLIDYKIPIITIDYQLHTPVDYQLYIGISVTNIYLYQSIATTYNSYILLWIVADSFYRGATLWQEIETGESHLCRF